MSKPKSAKHSFNNQQPRPTTASSEKKGWFSRMWSKITSFVKGLFRSVRDAFSIKPRTPEGKIANQSWFGKWIASPLMTAMGWVATAVVWLARWVTYILLAISLALIAIAAVVLLVVSVVVVAVILIAYRVVQGICLVFSTPWLAYRDRAESDAIWETYWKSWNPQYWAALRISDIEQFDDFFTAVRERHTFVPQEWFKEEDLWANATADGSAA